METLIKILKSKGLKLTRRTFKFNDLLISENEDITTEINEEEFEYEYVLYSLQKYLRDKHNIHIEIIGFVGVYPNNISYSYRLRSLKEYDTFLELPNNDENYDNYEECLKQSLLKSLQMI